ncbi:MAG: PAS domain-containing protein [Alphaproteobacteria bacterium]|nr:PAS domain-containing protein [Alphaproteobacteria bacterium]
MMDQAILDAFSPSRAAGYDAAGQGIASPALQDLLSYWLSCRGERAMPARDDLEEDALTGALKDLILFELSCVSGDGNAAAAPAAPAAAGLVAGMATPYHEVMRRAQPIYGSRSGAQGENVERLLLPLSRDGKRVDTILVGVQRRQAA